MDILNYEFIELLIGFIIAVLGIAYGYFSSLKLKQALNLSKLFAQKAACYMRIKVDGKITVEEKAEMGELSIQFFEGLEEITGVSVFNDASVPWIKPEEQKPTGVTA